MNESTIDDLRFRLKVSSRVTYFLLHVGLCLVLRIYVFPQLSYPGPPREGLIYGIASLIPSIFYNWLVGSGYNNTDRYFTLAIACVVAVMVPLMLNL
ncbi:hypothetical protein F4774DRAFT_367652 [Daldinia eschscholtzii]|nr:hypothetical protein F4774DRAFT_367652 [Daldinia eschscholtzii]